MEKNARNYRICAENSLIQKQNKKADIQTVQRVNKRQSFQV
jgi:hypothetical protein